MPDLPWLSRRDVPPIGDASLEALLAGAELPAGPPPELQPLSEMLAALKAGPAGDELAGEAAALAVFREGLGVSIAASRSRHRRHPLPTSLLSGKAAATVAPTVLSLGGLAASAYAGALPAPAQQLAHHTIGAPMAKGSSPTHTHASAVGTPAAPDATGPAAFGLCTAYAHAKAHGTSKQQATAFRNLAAAAGGTAQVAAYCAGVPHPGAPSSHAPHPTGRPSSHPAGPPTSHPAGRPASHPAGPPASHPAGPPASHP